MHLDGLDRVLEVGIEEWLSCRVAVDEDRVIAECSGQDVTDRAEDGQRVLSEQESGPVRIWLARLQNTEWGFDVRLGLVIGALMVAEIDLHRKKVSFPPLRILHDP